jgi:hypothetical protein
VRPEARGYEGGNLLVLPSPYQSGRSLVWLAGSGGELFYMDHQMGNLRIQGCPLQIFCRRTICLHQPSPTRCENCGRGSQRGQDHLFPHCNGLYRPQSGQCSLRDNRWPTIAPR